MKRGEYSVAFFSSTDLGTEPNQEFLTLILKPRIAFFAYILKLSVRARHSVSKFEIFFWFGLGLGYIMVCDVTLVFAQIRRVILIKELAMHQIGFRSQN